MQCGAGRKKKGGLSLGVDTKVYGSKRKSRRGGGYGFGGVMGTNGAEWTANNTSGDGNGHPTSKPSGGRRKRKGGRKTRRKTRGGGSIATVGYGFTGQGVRGLADPHAYNSNPPGPPGFMGK